MKPKPTEEAKQRAKNYMSLKGALELKQETLEEAAENYADDCTLVSDAAAYKGFIEGAKWQSERMYSEQEAYAIWKAGKEYWRTSGASITFEELLEQFKKK